MLIGAIAFFLGMCSIGYYIYLILRNKFTEPKDHEKIFFAHMVTLGASVEAANEAFSWIKKENLPKVNKVLEEAIRKYNLNPPPDQNLSRHETETLRNQRLPNRDNRHNR